MEFADRFRMIARLAPEETAIEHQGRDYDWGTLRRVADAVEALLVAGGIAPAVPIGWMAHNRPDMVGAALGLLQSGRYLAPVNPHQPVARLAEEVRHLAMAGLVGLAEDWASPEFAEAARATGALGIVVDIDADVPARLVPRLEALGPGPHRAAMPGHAMERMSSGTTGRPKRIPLKLADLEEGLIAGPPTREDAEAAKAGEVRRSASPAIMFNPFAHAGGIYGLVGALYFGRTISLHEKFKVAEWSAAVQRFRAPVANLVPAMLRMVLDAGVPREALSSLIAVRSGTAPLDPETQKMFEDRYGIPILIDYGASEFIGGVAGWGLREHRQFGAAKRGSVGRAKAGVSLRVSDEGRAEVPAGETGILEIRSDRFGPDWIRTTDLAAIDADGFLFIRGRADGVIIRGGFKIIPEIVSEILERHPAINEAVVLGVKDDRLGELPLAVVELRPDAARPDTEALDAFLREHLPPYQVPAAYEFVETLPRTVSLKIARPEVRAMLAGRYAFA
jgi:long-chain acyl-CoA synthetase